VTKLKRIDAGLVEVLTFIFGKYVFSQVKLPCRYMDCGNPSYFAERTLLPNMASRGRAILRSTYSMPGSFYQGIHNNYPNAIVLRGFGVSVTVVHFVQRMFGVTIVTLFYLRGQTRPRIPTSELERRFGQAIRPKQRNMQGWRSCAILDECLTERFNTVIKAIAIARRTGNGNNPCRAVGNHI
jgi:hypothetical protein